MRIFMATMKELDSAVDFAFTLQMNPETRCRPLLVDCKHSELYNQFKKHIEREQHDLILVYEDKVLIGVTPYYWMTADKYVTYYQGVYARDYYRVADFIMRYIEENFSGYKFYVNTARENLNQVQFYEENNFVKLEDATMLNLIPFAIDTSNFKVQKLNESNKESLYTSIDKLVDDDTYWNVDRLSRDLGRFIILGIFNPSIQGHIIGRKGGDSIEVISLLGNFEIKEKLIKSLVNESYIHGIKIVDLYTEESEEVEIGISLGFKVYDNNICYIKYL